jgi:hypothetical protein
MNAEQFAKEEFPGLNFSPKELETIWLGRNALEKEQADKDVEKVPPPDHAELLFSAKRDLAILAHQQKFTVDDNSWEKVFHFTLTNQNIMPPMVRNDVVYRVKTSKGSRVLVVCTGPDFHYFSLYADKDYTPEAYHLMCVGEYEIDKQTPGKFESDHRRIAETQAEIADLVEAKDWINKYKEGSFASHIFPEKKEILEFVNKVYELGAVKVTVGNISTAPKDDPQGLEFYADELIVRLPEKKSKREAIFSFINKFSEDLAPTDFYKEEGQKTISVYWDY